MKIAIMTQPLGTNYGGIMQAYALQRVLRGLGHEVITLDYHDPKSSRIYKATRLGYRLLQKLTGRRKSPIAMEGYYPDIFENTFRFIEDNISCSERVDSTSQLLGHFEKQSYDIVVVGSDQTWRPKYSPNIYNYFLEFLEMQDIKRVAYATSFGVDDWEFTEKETARCASLVETFDGVSVREKSGVQLCKQYLGIDANFVLDPTMLLTKQDYLHVIDSADLNKQGIFCYFLDKNAAKSDISDLISDHYALPLFSTYARLPLSSVSSSNIDDYKMPRVEDWLKSFSLANFVVTDSFHGCVFSIIFNVPFIVVANQQRGVARFESILRALGLEDRMVMSANEIDMEKLAEPIDWNEVNAKLAELRGVSQRFLKSSTSV